MRRGIILIMMLLFAFQVAHRENFLAEIDTSEYTNAWQPYEFIKFSLLIIKNIPVKFKHYIGILRTKIIISKCENSY